MKKVDAAPSAVLSYYDVNACSVRMQISIEEARRIVDEHMLAHPNLNGGGEEQPKPLPPILQCPLHLEQL
jgi:hypothetical protein